MHNSHKLALELAIQLQSTARPGSNFRTRLKNIKVTLVRVCTLPTPWLSMKCPEIQFADLVKAFEVINK